MIITEKNSCIGCTACVNVCALKAITMQADSEGFLYPVIDDAKCVECGKCKAICPSNTSVFDSLVDSATEPRVYAAKIKDEEIRKISTSGGAFSAIVQKVLKNNGVIYGAQFDENFKVVHGRATTNDDYKKFMGSKYVQSEIGNTFSLVKADLAEGKEVLFTGTPCQVAGLYAFLGTKLRDNLITCEIVCHGVPSPLMWKEHLSLIEKEKNSKIAGYKNRSKVEGWNCHNEHFFLENGKSEYKTKLSQNHKDLFYGHFIIRPSCHECKYAAPSPRVADIAIADYWGIENVMPDFYDNKGTSMIIVNTLKGEKVFEEIKSILEYRESNLTDAFKENHFKPARKNPQRAQFWEDYYENGYVYIVRKYAGYTTFGRIKRQVKFKAKELTKLMGLYKIIHKVSLIKYDLKG